MKTNPTMLFASFAIRRLTSSLFFAAIATAIVVGHLFINAQPVKADLIIF